MSQPKDIAIYGAGGFGREVAWLLAAYERSSAYRMLGFVDDAAKGDEVVNAKPVFTLHGLKALCPECSLIVAVGDPQIRERLANKALEHGFCFTNIRHHSVEVSDFVSLGVGIVICCGSVLTVNIEIGNHVHINMNCTIGHDVKIGEFTTLSPGVHVSGNVHIGRGVFLGTGTNIINGTKDKPLVLQDGCVIAAGACVTKSIKMKGLYAGVPADIKKTLP